MAGSTRVALAYPGIRMVRLTTQAVGGQLFQNGKRTLEPRVKAAVIMSPSSPRVGVEANTAFAGVTMPWLLMTGTKDTFIIGGADVNSRRAVYAALPARWQIRTGTGQG